MFLINECMATLTAELPGLQSADAEDMKAITTYSERFQNLVTDLRNYGNDVQGHFGGHQIEVGDARYESAAARTHNEFVNRVDKEMSSLYNWMKDTWAKEPILDWAQREVKHEYDENGYSSAFNDADVESSKKKHTGLAGREDLLNKARARGWGKSHIKYNAADIDAYKGVHNLHNSFQDLATGDYQISAAGCRNFDAVRRDLEVSKTALCPSVKLFYDGTSTANDYTFKVTHPGIGASAIGKSITIPKTIKPFMTDRQPVYTVSVVGCRENADVLDILAVDGSNLCPEVQLTYTGREVNDHHGVPSYEFKVKDNGGGGLMRGSTIELKKPIKEHLSEATM